MQLDKFVFIQERLNVFCFSISYTSIFYKKLETREMEVMLSSGGVRT
jgi:hypothetical protein